METKMFCQQYELFYHNFSAEDEEARILPFTEDEFRQFALGLEQVANEYSCDGEIRKCDFEKYRFEEGYFASEGCEGLIRSLISNRHIDDGEAFELRIAMLSTYCPNAIFELVADEICIHEDEKSMHLSYFDSWRLMIHNGEFEFQEGQICFAKSENPLYERFDFLPPGYDEDEDCEDEDYEDE